MAAKKVLSATQQKNKATLKEKLKGLTVDQLRTKLKGKVKLSTREGKPLTKAQLVNKAADLQVTTPTQKKKVAKRTPTRNYTYKGDSAAARKRDGVVQALPPGKRVSKTGKTYFEYRRNRADIKQGAKRGQMLGGGNFDGYTNYETWLAALWFDNNRDVQRALKYANDAADLQERTYDYFYEQIPKEGWWLANVINDYIREIDFRELFEKINEE